MVVAGVLGAFLVVFFVIVAIAQGIGNPSVPSGDIALVQDAPDGHISTADYQTALQQAAAAGQTKVPPPSSPQYAALRDSAVGNLLLAAWVRGEAEERGITLSDSEISSQLKQITKQYGGPKGLQQVLKQAHLTPQQARGQIELKMLSDAIQKQVLPANPSVSDSDVEDFYNANKVQFSTAEARDVRQILNKDEAKVQQAKALLEKDDSPANWKKVAAKYSTDTATKDSGGLRSGVAKGQSDPALEAQIFSAPQGQLVGPFKAQAGFYVIEVEKITPASTTPLSKASAQIKQQLAQGRQQEIGQSFQQDFLDKWRSRTFCADGYVIDRCENFTATPAVDPGRSSRDLDTRRLARSRDRVPRTAGPGSAAGADSAAIGRRTARRDRPRRPAAPGSRARRAPRPPRRRVASEALSGG